MFWLNKSTCFVGIYLNRQTNPVFYMNESGGQRGGEKLFALPFALRCFMGWGRWWQKRKNDFIFGQLRTVPKAWPKMAAKLFSFDAPANPSCSIMKPGLLSAITRVSWVAASSLMLAERWYYGSWD